MGYFLYRVQTVLAICFKTRFVAKELKEVLEDMNTRVLQSQQLLFTSKLGDVTTSASSVPALLCLHVNVKLQF